MSKAEYIDIAGLEHRFDLLQDRIANLESCLRDNGYSLWTPFEEAFDPDGWIHKALTDIWYEEGQDGRSTRSYVGIIMVPSATMAAVEKVNESKSAFYSYLANLKKQFKGQTSEIKNSLASRQKVVGDTLNSAGLSRVNLKQCWRKLPVSPAPLDKVHLSWYSSGRSISKVTVEEVANSLYKLGSNAEHIRIYLKKLSGLPPGEVLARVQKQSPLVRANLFFKQPLMDGKDRMAMNLSMPLFAESDELILPRVNKLPSSPPLARTRKVRRDEKLEDEPFLAELRLYRYR